MTFEIRPATFLDLESLKRALWISVVWRSQSPPPIDSIVELPELRLYWSGWGRRGDLGLIAEESGTFAGAAFGRLFTRERPSYGFVDEETPEVGIGLESGARRRGLGRRMMVELERMYAGFGSRRLSLSVNLDNPARRLYDELGYVELDRDDSSARMVKDIA